MTGGDDHRQAGPAAPHPGRAPHHWNDHDRDHAPGADRRQAGVMAGTELPMAPGIAREAAWIGAAARHSGNGAVFRRIADWSPV